MMPAWTSEDIAEFERLWFAGFPYQDIAARMGRKCDSVRVMAQRMNLRRYQHQEPPPPLASVPYQPEMLEPWPDGVVFEDSPDADKRLPYSGNTGRTVYGPWPGREAVGAQSSMGGKQI